MFIELNVWADSVSAAFHENSAVIKIYSKEISRGSDVVH